MLSLHVQHCIPDACNSLRGISPTLDHCSSGTRGRVRQKREFSEAGAKDTRYFSLESSCWASLGSNVLGIFRRVVKGRSTQATSLLMRWQLTSCFSDSGNVERVMREEPQQRKKKETKTDDGQQTAAEILYPSETHHEQTHGWFGHELDGHDGILQ